MKKAIILFFLTCAVAFAQEPRYIHGNYEFEPGSTEYLFGDNVKLRTAPSTDSEVLEFLEIARPIKILGKTEVKQPFEGYDAYWYKVKKVMS
ncbi:SH3 domain-containing protein [Maribacter halichondriae]|uniref:SH3 domain-containing protein n=1 Tax=Maribacter halichondriae TaxID=2980554 RepID=UPI002358472C|nr:SH3 domain-containing protein [Maribacter sp. Hal144]